jgi:hypothetical protein
MSGARCWIVIAAAVWAAAAAPLAAQSTDAPRVRAAVRQIAGTTLYFDLGARHGLAQGDTIVVLRDPAAPPIGLLVVTALSEARSVLAPAAAGALPVAAGDTLTLVLRRPPPVVAAGAPAPAPPRPVRAATGAPAPRARPYGSLALELDAGRYLTRFGGIAESERTHTSTAPAFRLDLTVPDLGAGFRLRTGGRLTYRQDHGSLGARAASLRVYSLALERAPAGSSLRLGVGRFHSPSESYSGFWDGLHVRYGRDVGIGFLVGYQPDLWNERPSLERPKATVVLDAARRGTAWRWTGDASFHRVWAGAATRTFAGLSQTLSVRALRLSHDVQLDRHPADGAWGVTRATVRASLALGDALAVHAAAARRAPLIEYADTLRWDPPGDRVSVGMTLGSGETRFSADVARMSGAGGSARSYSASLVGPGVGAARVEAAAAYWEGEWGTSWFGAPGLALGLGGTRLRIGYRYDRSDYLERALVTHGAELGGDFALGSAVRATVRLRAQEGASTRSAVVDLSLSRIF